MREPKERLRDILEAIAAIERYAARGRKAFEEDELVQNWMVRHLQIIGEAARALPDEVRARIPGTLDDKIELNERMNRTLEAIAQALFKSWFVGFDPVRAKAEGRETGLPPEIDRLFPDSFEDSEIGEIPKGWKVKAIREILEMNPQRSLRRGQVAPYVAMDNMPTSSPRPLGWVNRAFTSGMRFMNGDVLVARITPCLENGKTAFVDFLADRQVAWGSTEYIVFRSRPPVPEEYAYFLARSDDFRSYAITNMTGTSGRQRVPVECFESYRVVLPSDDVLVRFGELSKAVLAPIRRNDCESRTLANIRDALLPKLMSGEVWVKVNEA